jgi:hypothetical protein
MQQKLPHGLLNTLVLAQQQMLACNKLLALVKKIPPSASP